MIKQKNKIFFILAFCMALVVVLSNYFVQFPVKYFGLENVLTYGAFTYPIAFLITDLSNRRYGKSRAKKIVYLGFSLGVFLTFYFSTNYSDIVESELWPDLDDNFIETLLNEAAKLADNSIAPLNQSADKAGSILNNGNVSTAPGFKEAYKELVNSSWGTISGLKDYGGQGLPKTIAVMIQELWNTSCMSFSLCPMLTQGAVEAISHHGTENQKKEYLPKLLTGEWSGTMNLTEPHAGSDVGALKTSAKKNIDGSYSIKGTKIYITYGDHDMAENIIHLVLARIEGAPEGNNGISLFIVPKFIKNQKSKIL